MLRTKAPIHTNDPAAWADYNARQAGAVGLGVEPLPPHRYADDEAAPTLRDVPICPELDETVSCLTPSGELIAAVRDALNKTYAAEAALASLLFKLEKDQ